MSLNWLFNFRTFTKNWLFYLVVVDCCVVLCCTLAQLQCLLRIVIVMHLTVVLYCVAHLHSCSACWELLLWCTWLLCCVAHLHSCSACWELLLWCTAALNSNILMFFSLIVTCFFFFFFNDLAPRWMLHQILIQMNKSTYTDWLYYYTRWTNSPHRITTCSK